MAKCPKKDYLFFYRVNPLLVNEAATRDRQMAKLKGSWQNSKQRFKKR
jgi:hypothetical protein